MITREQLTAVVVEAQAQLERASERSSAADATAAAARLDVALAQGALDMAQHLLAQDRVVPAVLASAMPGIIPGMVTGDAATEVAIEAERGPANAPPAFIQR